MVSTLQIYVMGLTITKETILYDHDFAVFQSIAIPRIKEPWTTIELMKALKCKTFGAELSHALYSM